MPNTLNIKNYRAYLVRSNGNILVFETDKPVMGNESPYCDGLIFHTVTDIIAHNREEAKQIAKPYFIELCSIRLMNLKEECEKIQKEYEKEKSLLESLKS